MTSDNRPSHCPACLKRLPIADGLDSARVCPNCQHVMSVAATAVLTGAQTPDAKHRQKACVRCKCDVTGDRYRVKLGDHYLCGDCADREIARGERTRVRRPRIAAAMLVLMALIASLVWVSCR